MHVEGHDFIEFPTRSKTAKTYARFNTRRTGYYFTFDRFFSVATRKQLTVWVQFHGRLMWQEYSAPDRRAASHLTVDAIIAANERQDGCEHLLIEELMFWTSSLMMSSSFALRGRPKSSLMMDLLTPLTIHPFGHHYSRLCLHPLHLRLQRKEREIHISFMARYRQKEKINDGGRRAVRWMLQEGSRFLCTLRPIFLLWFEVFLGADKDDMFNG